MNHHINPAKTAITLATFLGGVHFIWSIFVALGWAQALINFKLWAHMVSVPVVVKTFNLSAATTLILISTVMGYIVGYAFALIWNRMHRG
jgi:hypothetical protein